MMNFDLSLTTLFYDFFESAVDLSLDSLSELMVSMHSKNGMYNFRLALCTDSDMTVLADKFRDASIEKEDGVWYCTLTARKGDDAL